MPAEGLPAHPEFLAEFADLRVGLAAPTDIDPTVLCADARPQTAIPEVEDQACAAQVRGQVQSEKGQQQSTQTSLAP